MINDGLIKTIWEKFTGSYCTEHCRKLMNEIEKLSRARLHRVRNIYSEKHREFLQNQLRLIKKLENENLHLNLAEDRVYFINELEKSKLNN